MNSFYLISYPLKHGFSSSTFESVYGFCVGQMGWGGEGGTEEKMEKNSVESRTQSRKVWKNQILGKRIRRGKKRNVNKKDRPHSGQAFIPVQCVGGFFYP